MARIKVPIPAGGENNLESKFLRAQSGDQEAVKEYREALDAEPHDIWDCPDWCTNPAHQGPKPIKAHCMGTEFPKREEK